MKYSTILITFLLATSAALNIQSAEAPVSAQTLPQAADQQTPPNGKRDIANKEVRPDVYKTVVKMIDPVPERRRSKPPPKQKTWDEGPMRTVDDDDSFAKKNTKK